MNVKTKQNKKKMEKAKENKKKKVKKKSEYELAKERLEKAQAKYIKGGKATKPTFSKNLANGKLSARSQRKKRWQGWRETDGVVYPVTPGLKENKKF